MDTKQLLNDSTGLENPLHSVKTCDKLYKANKMKKEDAYLYNGESTMCAWNNPTKSIIYDFKIYTIEHSLPMNKYIGLYPP